MNGKLLQAILLYGALFWIPPTVAGTGEFSFGVIAPPLMSASTDTVQDAIEETDADNLAFVVANGIKAADEPCTDAVYQRKKALLLDAKNGVIVSLAASDWAECKGDNEKSAAVGKLNRLRELFFVDEFSLGASKIPVIRQSTVAKFRSFSENARWEIGSTLFATINLPANNNHYVFDAGRNGEFEDRLIANKDWLHRIFTNAVRRKMDGIVLFCDGNPLTHAGSIKRDGFAETRRHILSLAAKFPGKVLIIHGRTGKPSSDVRTITWRNNIGELEAKPGWLKVNVNNANPALFTLAGKAAYARMAHR